MACQVCRARKVKCDGRVLNGCLNCARLELACDLDRDGSASRDGRDRRASPAAGSPGRRTYRSCTGCRAAKTKCNGDVPACLRCRARSIACAYSTTSGPIWTRLLSKSGGSSSSSSNDNNTQARPQSLTPAGREHAGAGPPPTESYLLPQGEHESGLLGRTPASSAVQAVARAGSADDGSSGGDTHALSWLYTAQLPEDPVLLRRVADHYFSNVHPLRCFAFVHKPSFMRKLDDAAALGGPGSDEMALLQIICAHGAKFCALAHSEAVQPQPAPRIQAAGHEWAKAAEQTLMTNYGRITVTSLMTAVLLYDYRYRLGDFAHALVMSGLTTRMAHALQLNIAGEGTGDYDAGGTAALPPVAQEARRRLMWACYVIDTWTGSGMDQLTLLREQDLHIQLPCNERDFLFQRAVATHQLSAAGPDANTGMMASYIRLVSIWKRVARYVKHLDTAALPWRPGSEFAVLDEALRAWRDGLAPYLDFSADSIYTRLESSQLGALALLHCTYFNAMLDLYRIAMPELFSLRHAFAFPPDKTDVLHALQARSFRLACDMAAVLAKTAAQGARHLADSMTPMFAYNSSRVMLYYLVRLHDPSRPDTKGLVEETIQHVQSNNRVLQLASAMMPLSEPLLVTARRWLQKLQTGLHRQDAGAPRAGVIPSGSVDIAGLADPTAGHNAAVVPRHHYRQRDNPHGSREPHDYSDGAAEEGSDADSTDTPDNVLHPLSLFRLARKTLNATSSQAPYAGGGLPPLRDVTGYSHSHGDGRPMAGERPPPPPPLSPEQFSAAAAVAAAAPPPVASYPTVLPAAAAAGAFSSWESAFDDLATGLHVLQEYPHWDLNGFDHMGSGVFHSSGLVASWPEDRGKLP